MVETDTFAGIEVPKDVSHALHPVSAEMTKRAKYARDQAYAYESEYKVGACVRTYVGGSREYFEGANIEVSGRSTSIHAEMLAMFNAVLSGADRFTHMVVVMDEQAGPCGLCAHTMAQFTEDMPIMVVATEEPISNRVRTYNLKEDLNGKCYTPSTRHSDAVVDSV